MEKQAMTLKERIEQIVADLNPRLEDLADGYVEVLDIDEAGKAVTLKSFGGRLH
jgi:Fe-S cluster biogenesis protein NfuA